MFETMSEYQEWAWPLRRCTGIRLFVAGFAPRPDEDDEGEDERVPLMVLIGEQDHDRRRRFG